MTFREEPVQCPFSHSEGHGMGWDTGWIGFDPIPRGALGVGAEGVL